MSEKSGESARGIEAQYVVLHHTGYGEDHYDLMLDVPGNDKLMTWHVGIEPAQWDWDIGAQRIADHRKEYLIYEGEVSGGRGTVRRVSAGRATVDNRDLSEQWLTVYLHELKKMVFLETIID